MENTTPLPQEKIHSDLSELFTELEIDILRITPSLHKQIDSVKNIFIEFHSSLENFLTFQCTHEKLNKISVKKEHTRERKLFLKAVSIKINHIQMWREKINLLPCVNTIKIPQTIDNPFEEGRLLPIYNLFDFIAFNFFIKQTESKLQRIDAKYRSILGILNMYVNMNSPLDL